MVYQITVLPDINVGLLDYSLSFASNPANMSTPDTHVESNVKVVVMIFPMPTRGETMLPARKPQASYLPMHYDLVKLEERLLGGESDELPPGWYWPEGYDSWEDCYDKASD